MIIKLNMTFKPTLLTETRPTPHKYTVFIIKKRIKLIAN